MVTPSHFEKRIDEAMSSVDRVRRAPAPDFLYTRVMAALNARDNSPASVVFQWILRPSVAYALVLLILLLNLWVVLDASAPAKNDQLYVGEYGMHVPQEELIYTLNPEEQP